MKIKYKIISILAIIITIMNISSISSASGIENVIETKDIDIKETLSLDNSKDERKEKIVTIEKEETVKKIETVEKQNAVEKQNTLETYEANELNDEPTENVVEEINVEILNQDKETKEPIQGNVFSILNEDDTVFKENLQTNEEGKINFTLTEGKYYLKQTSTIEGYNLNKALIEIDTSNTKNINIKIESAKPSYEETTTVNKEINIVEENKDIVDNQIKSIANYNLTNIIKEIRNETNTTDLNNINNFINTTNKENIANITKENFYRNNIDENLYTTTMRAFGDNLSFSKTRQDYVNYMDMIMMNSTRVPLLPAASK